MPDAAIRAVLPLQRRHRAHAERGREDAPQTDHRARASHRHRPPGRTPAQARLCHPHIARLAAIRHLDRRADRFALDLSRACQPGRELLVSDRDPGADGASLPTGSTNGSEHAHEPPRAFTAGVLHRPTAHPTPSEPEHDRRLPPHLPAAVAVRGRPDRHAAQRAGHRRSRRAADRLVPRPPRTQPPQHDPDPQQPPRGDPLAVRLPRAAPPRARRHDPAGARDPAQTDRTRTC